jgi:hypothetical protein
MVIFNTFLRNKLDDLRQDTSASSAQIEKFVNDLIRFLVLFLNAEVISDMQNVFANGSDQGLTSDLYAGDYPTVNEPGKMSIPSLFNFTSQMMTGASHQQVQFALAMQLFFATCLHIAMNHATHYIATDYNIRSYLAFRPPQAISRQSNEELARSYRYVTLFYQVTVQVHPESNKEALYNHLLATHASDGPHIISIPTQPHSKDAMMMPLAGLIVETITTLQ